ncbi:hypothetical protein L873DRAFT_397429 [Choiromyces venosus 120613-1]|uniref:Myb-like DNA-binding domain-containing protein n=1 Tax=Choiromyces venosus 120613-1 TaxID=1336337 RepID=A0A3N4J2B2_9PEZI|nr:hypothetical protein L873DRAFT_397429 [Choiromyces venosus 120613-1]
MPAKAPIDENVKFLFACLIRSDYKTIDFTRVAADFNINPAAARMRWSRLKKTINMDDIAASVLGGKKRRNGGRVRLPSPASVKVEDVPSQLSLPPPPPPPAAAREDVILKEEEAVEEEEAAPVLFTGLPEPQKCRRAEGGKERVSIPVVDEDDGLTGGFAATQVPHLPRVAGATAVAGIPPAAAETEVPGMKAEPPTLPEAPPVLVVQAPTSTLKSEQKIQLEEEIAMKSEPPPSEEMRETTGGSAVTVILTANGSKKRKLEST